MLKAALLSTLAIVGSCVGFEDPAAIDSSPVPIPVHWIVDELDDRPFDARHGDRVDVVLATDQQRCDWMGGVLVLVPVPTCTFVDF